MKEQTQFQKIVSKRLKVNIEGLTYEMAAAKIRYK